MFTNYNEKEEASCMKSITLLRFAAFKSYIIVPIVSLLSVFVIPLLIYWYPDYEKYWLYSEVSSISRATHLFI